MGSFFHFIKNSLLFFYILKRSIYTSICFKIMGKHCYDGKNIIAIILAPIDNLYGIFLKNLL